MHSYTSRANAFLSHVLLVLSAVALVGSLVGYRQMRDSRPSVSLSAHKIEHFKPLARERCDQAYVQFDLRADLRPLWNWNTNHIFAYVVAEYETPKRPRNEVVLWDAILSDKTEAQLNATKQWNKYSLKDYSYGLRGKEVKLKFKYSIMPYMGAFIYGEQGETLLTLPKDYLKQ